MSNSTTDIPHSPSAFDVLSAISFAQGVVTLGITVTLATFAFVVHRVASRRQATQVGILGSYQVLDIERYQQELDPKEQHINHQYCRDIRAYLDNLPRQDGRYRQPLHVSLRRAFRSRTAGKADDPDKILKQIEEANIRFVLHSVASIHAAISRVEHHLNDYGVKAASSPVEQL